MCGVLDISYPSRLCLIEVLNEEGKMQWSALPWAGVSHVRPWEVLRCNWRDREDDVHLLGEGNGEELRGDITGIHVQA